MLKLTVDKNSKDAFSSISKALASLSEPKDNEEVIIHILPGTYYEKITINVPNVTLLGDDPANTIITCDDYAFDTMPDGSKRGTFRSYTMFVDASDVTLKGLTIENSSAPRSQVGQAIALYADGDRFQAIDCILKSYQDTLFTGPLPLKELQPGGFVGPKEFAPRIATRQYYKNCTISGDIDFIFGSAIAYFDECEIKSVYSEVLPLKENGEVPVYGYVTAPSTQEGSKYGYVFNKCNFTSTCPKASVYLARPWRNHAKTVILNSYIGEHIRPEGFHDWNKLEARDTIFFGEYKNYGPGSTLDARASFSNILSDEEALEYTKDLVLSGKDGWMA